MYVGLRTHLWNLKKERLRRRNQCDRDCRAAESAQQMKAQLTRQRVRDRIHRASQSGAQRERVLCYKRGLLASETSRPENESSRVGASLSDQKRSDSVLHN